jgi:hypothetical protein
VVQDVQFEVRNNTGDAYTVSQVINDPFTSQSGEEYPGDLFEVQAVVDGANARGQSQMSGFRRVNIGSQTVFSSDGNGSSATVTVQYRLRSHWQLRPGDYKTRVMFSLEPR